MNNKKMLKKLFAQEINKDEIYANILEKNNLSYQHLNILKWSLIPLVIILFISIFNKSKPNIANVYTTSSNNTADIYINKINTLNIKENDIKIKEITKLPYIKLTNLVIPSSLTNKKYYAYYTKKNQTSKTYNILYNYVISYTDKENFQELTISYSKKYIPLKEYSYEAETFIPSKINNLDLVIYEYQENYFTEFSYHNLNYNITASNITKEELITFLKSLIN